MINKIYRVLITDHAGAMCLHVCPNSTHDETYKIITIIIAHLQMRKLRLKEIKQLVQSG